MKRNTLEGGGPLHSGTAELPRVKSVFSRFIASVLAAVLTVAGLVALGPAAVAAPAGISTTPLLNGNPLADDTVVEPDDTFTLRVQYDRDVDASEPVIIGVPEDLSFDDSALEVPSGNTAIDSIARDGNRLAITFNDPSEWDVDQGIYDLNFLIQGVEQTESQTITWTVGDQEYSRTVIVRDGDAEEENVSDHLAKSVDTANLNQFVNVNQGVVSLDESILNHVINYTLEMNTDRDTDRSEITISDELSQYLMYNEDSFNAEITTWDDIGWNPTTEDYAFNPEFSDDGFVFSGGVENPSELTVTYSAQVDPEQLDALTADLQAQFDDVEGTGDYGVDLDNTVTFGEYGEREANVTIGGTRDESDSPTEVEDYLDKSAANTGLDQYVSFDSSGNVILDEGVLNHAIEYTLTVDTAADTDRTGFTIADSLSQYLTYNQDSFNAEISTSDDGGWTWKPNPFDDYEVVFADNGFTFTGDIPSSSELTITYTASVDEDQFDALREAIQAEFDDLDVEPGDYRVQLDNTATFGGDQEREANVSIGNNRGEGEGPENVSNYLDKQAGETALSEFVSVYEGVVSVDEDILNAAINYTLTVNTDRDTDRSDFTITDELSQYLAYDEDSFDAEITTWGENGWDEVTNDFTFVPTFTDNGFTFTGDIASPSELTITYSASVAEGQLEALTAALQEDFDALEVGYGDFGLELENTASFGGETRSDEVPINGSVGEPPVPQPGDAFNKDADFSSVNIATGPGGTIEPPQEIIYTFSANLSQWDGQAEDGYLNRDDFTLDRNVVISDALPEQAAWDTSAEDFISGMDLTEAEGFDGDSVDFAADEYVNQYAVVDQNLYINIGQDSETNAEISVKALITTVDGLPSADDGGVQRYELTNDAEFTFNDEGEPYGSSVQVTMNDRGDGLEDEATFSKTALDGDDPVYVDEGESATLDYRFETNRDSSNAVDVTQSYIVDERDPNIFDFTDLDQTVDSISGSLQGDTVAFDESHFDLSVNDDGNLIIALNDAGIGLVEDSSAEATAPYVVDISLNTVPLSSRQTLEVENAATLYGSDNYPLYWSETTSEASSYGNEAETRKSIRDSFHEEWTQNLRVDIGEDGELIEDEYVYNLAFVPHGNYSAVEISPVVDELPEEVEFVGFIDHEDVDTGANPTDGPKDIGGNLEAVYNEDDHTVTVRQQEGTLLTQEENISANVLVRIVEFEEDVPVANFFGNSSAEYTPSDGYPISIAKVNSQNDEVLINDPESRFQVLDDEDNVVVEDAFVEDGQLRVLDEDGDTTGLVVREPGTYYVEETVAPEGYELSTDRIAVVVDTYGNSEQQTFLNDPIPDVEIIKGDGDAEEGTIANDANTEDDAEQYSHLETRDVVITVENTGTEDLVDVVLTDETQSGTAIENLEWALPNGETVEATANDDGVLTAEWDGPWAVGETITGTATLTLTAGEELHTNLASVDAVGAASGTPVEDDDPYNADPAERDYAIGDYVWIDANNDGIQDADEEPLEGVTVVLYDQDGEEVERETTDERGRYFFDNLPAGDYSVQFILTEEQASTYKFTDALVGEVDADSDAGEEGRSGVITLGEDNEFLTADEDYEYFDITASEGIDPTWDAGVVLLDPAVEIIKGDGDAEEGTIANDANTEDDAEPYSHLETRDVVITVENTGNEDLVGVVLTDETQSGTAIESLVWALPNGDTVEATANDDGVLTAEWDGPWAVGETITGTATLTLTAGEELHTNLASVEANGAASGTPVEDDDPYNADPAERDYAVGDYVWIDANNDGIQDEDEDPLADVTVVLYDGEGNEIADTTTDERGRYFFDNLPAGDYQVGFELTDEQAATYKFTDALVGDVEADSDAGEEGLSTVFTLGQDNEFLTADEDYEYFDITASEGIDPTWDAGVVLLDPAVEIIKGDGDAEEGTIANDANTEEDAVAYEDGETRDIVITVENTGNEDLVDVVLTDETQSGADIEALVWTLPNGETIEATTNDEGVLTAEWDGPWAVGDTITGVATLTLAEGEELHTNLASVDAIGAESGTPVEDDDPYYATPPEVIEETPPPGDGEEPTPDPTDDPSGPTDPETAGDREGELSSTGANFVLIFGALGLLLLLIGGVLYARNRTGSNA